VHGVGSRNKLTPSHARLYPGAGTLDVLGRAVCAANCLPRKELHEAWEMATRVRRAFPVGGGERIVDLCSGYGLLAQVLLILDDNVEKALAVDVHLPANRERVREAVAAAFPVVRRLHFVASPLSRLALTAEDLVVSAHACGHLTDDVLARASDAGARVAVLPCCHRTRSRADLAGRADPAAVIDDERVERLVALGYDVLVEAIPVDVSPKNRLLLAWPGH
jgi:SAM-dependent methyltransferase